MEIFLTYLNWVSVLASLVACIFSIYSLRKTQKEANDYKKRLELNKQKHKDKVKEIKDEY